MTISPTPNPSPEGEGLKVAGVIIGAAIINMTPV